MRSHLVRWRALVPAALTLFVLACSSDFAASLGPGFGGTGTLLGLTPDALIGRWSHVETNDGVDGGVVSQTTWQFDSGGAATRTITRFTVFGTPLSTSTTQARWSLSVGFLLLDFNEPVRRIVRVPISITFGVQATTLFLDGVPFQRTD
jgi:hypothetical protein